LLQKPQHCLIIWALFTNQSV